MTVSLKQKQQKKGDIYEGGSRAAAFFRMKSIWAK
jgi:hypothetical protein